MSKQIRKSVSFVILAAFFCTSIKSPAFAQLSEDPMPFMSKPGSMVPLSPEYAPAYLKGIVIHPENALKFDFIIYKGDKELTDDQKRDEYTKLTKYFLASLAIPDDDQWVNLSPYEKDRIIKDDFGKTEMGRDLLAQDYMLKQITASLIYPEDSLGKEFWDKVYTEAQKQYGTTDIPVNTFNKVWILPDDALIYEKGNTAYVLKNHLRVMLEEDYLSLKKHAGIQSAPAINKTHTIASKIIKEIVLPELEREVNEDQNFATVRQVYSGMLLATWYKHALRESLLSRIYADKSKVKGVDQNPQNNELIYRQYLRAYKKGVFNFIKEDVDKYTNETIPRKYFSGGTEDYAMAARTLGHNPILISHDLNTVQVEAVQNELGNNKDDYAEMAVDESLVAAKAAVLAQGAVSQVTSRASDTAMTVHMADGTVALAPFALLDSVFSFLQGKNDQAPSEMQRSQVDALTSEYMTFSPNDPVTEEKVHKIIENSIPLVGGLQLPFKDSDIVPNLEGKGLVLLDGNVKNSKPNLMYPARPISGILQHPDRAMSTNYDVDQRLTYYKDLIEENIGKNTFTGIVLAMVQDPVFTTYDFPIIPTGISKRSIYYLSQARDIRAQILSNFIRAKELKSNLRNPTRGSLNTPVQLSNSQTVALSIKFFIDYKKVKAGLSADLESALNESRTDISRMSDEQRVAMNQDSIRRIASNNNVDPGAFSGLIDNDFVGLIKQFEPNGIIARISNNEEWLRDNAQVSKPVISKAERPIPIVTPKPGESIEITEGLRGKIGKGEQFVNGSPSSATGSLGRGSAQGEYDSDRAALANSNLKGGIDFNSANLSLQIKRDGHGVPLPISQQDLEHINIDGLIPVIIAIKPATSLPIFTELQNTPA